MIPICSTLANVKYGWFHFVANLLAWPAGTVPVTTTRSDEEDYMPPLREQDSMYRLAKKACEGSAGLPVGVQIMMAG